MPLLTLLVVAGLFLVVQFSAQNGLAAILSSHEDGDFFIEPGHAEISLSDSYTFTSYEQVSTKTVAQESEHSGDVAGEVILMAEDGDEAAEATIQIEEELEESPYTDDIPDWAEASVYLLNDRGIMMGYSTGEFGSGDPVTRAQFTTLYYRILDLAYPEVPDIVSSCDVYDDVDSSSYAYDAICFGHYGNWFTDMETGANFNPDQPLLRKEAALILSNSFLAGLFENYYAPLFGLDIDTVDFAAWWVYDDVREEDMPLRAIGLVAYFELMTGITIWDEYGRSSQYFYPDNSINRAEAAVIFDRFVGDLELE